MSCNWNINPMPKYDIEIYNFFNQGDNVCIRLVCKVILKQTKNFEETDIWALRLLSYVKNKLETLQKD